MRQQKRSKGCPEPPSQKIEALTQIKRRFSKIGLIFFVISALMTGVQLPVMWLLGWAAPWLTESRLAMVLLKRMAPACLPPRNSITAVLVSGLLFGLFHMDVSQIIYAVPMGMFLGGLYARTGKIGYAVSIHMAINLLGGTLADLVPEGWNPVLCGLPVICMTVW